MPIRIVSHRSSGIDPAGAIFIRWNPAGACEMTLRRATADDARSIAVVHVASTQAAYRGLFPAAALDGIDIDDRTERWRQIFTDAKSTTLVAESDGRIIGFVNHGPCRDEDAAASRVGEVMSIYIAPDSWGKGLGRVLLLASMKQLASAGFCEVKTWVLVGNARAVAFYEHAGFERDGMIVHREMFGVPVTVVRYRLCLPHPYEVTERESGKD